MIARITSLTTGKSARKTIYYLGGNVPIQSSRHESNHRLDCLKAYLSKLKSAL